MIVTVVVTITFVIFPMQITDQSIKYVYTYGLNE